jgi:hypothetical protein
LKLRVLVKSRVRHAGSLARRQIRVVRGQLLLLLRADEPVCDVVRATATATVAVGVAVHDQLL